MCIVASCCVCVVQVGVLQGAIDEVDSSQPKTVTSHEQPLCAALYNPNFKQVGGLVTELLKCS